MNQWIGCNLILRCTHISKEAFVYDIVFPFMEMVINCCKNRTASLSLLRDNKLKYKMTNQFSGISKCSPQKKVCPIQLRLHINFQRLVPLQK